MVDEEKLLEVKNLSIRFGREEVLSDVSFTAAKGEAVALIGPNGAGKTTLFRALLGLVPYSGSVTWKEGVKIGYVPQKLSIDRSTPVTVEEFLLLKAKHFWIPEKSFLEHLHHELSLVGLEESVLKRSLGALSTGQLQRLLISWAMLDHPEVLLFDEPTAGIDVGFAETVYNLMHRMQQERGTTILLISHDLNIVYRYANTVLCIDQALVCKGKPHEVLNPQELARLYGNEGGFYNHADRHNT